MKMFEEINENTKILLPIAHAEYATKIVNVDGEVLSKKTPLELIREACIEGGATYKGRKDAVQNLFNISHRVPIPIAPERGIYAFPTHSPKQWQNKWIFYFHIKHIYPVEVNKVMLVFTDGGRMELDLSYHTLEKQRQRTSQCIVKFSHVNPHNRNLFYLT
jgi:competence protein ComK